MTRQSITYPILETRPRKGLGDILPHATEVDTELLQELASIIPQKVKQKNNLAIINPIPLALMVLNITNIVTKEGGIEHVQVHHYSIEIIQVSSSPYHITCVCRQIQPHWKCYFLVQLPKPTTLPIKKKIPSMLTNRITKCNYNTPCDLEKSKQAK